jgi:UPF0755 protein
VSAAGPDDPTWEGEAGDGDPEAVVGGGASDGQADESAHDGDAAAEAPASRAARRHARSERVRRNRRIVGLVGAALLVVILAFVTWYELESNALGPEGRQVVVTVHQGESADSVISALSQQHVIGSALAFRISDIFHGSPNPLPGSYAMHENQTFSEVRALLAAGPNIYPVNVRPGFTFSEVAEQVDSIPGHDGGGFKATMSSGAVHSPFASPGSTDLEGLLGTGIYLVLPGESDTTILSDMVARFDKNAAVVGLTPAAATALGVSEYQLVVAASVVEKEGYYTVNMPDVARVIYNRLAQDLPLQMDSTVLYAIGQDGGPVTPADLKIQSPYNTYLNKGLPPTPICMPSLTALKAAVNPPPGQWLYFTLVQKNGVMAFSNTYAEQLANEQLAKSRGLP